MFMMMMVKKRFCLMLMLGGMVLSFAPSIQAEKVSLSEYLRLEVMAKAMYKRAKEDPRWEKLIRPQYSKFRELMQKFILESYEARGMNALPPAGYIGPKVDWAKLKRGDLAIDFDRVPDPWFNLQAERIKHGMEKIEPVLFANSVDQEKMINLFKKMADDIVAWPRPPFAKPSQ